MDRATAPVVAIALLVGITVLAASGVATVAFALDAPTEPTQVAVSLTVDAAADRIALAHRGGDTLNVTRLSLLVTVDGDQLAHQPPVPFFSARGFRAGPTGPFNTGSEPDWHAGEAAGFRLASTNAPSIETGDQVTVTIRREEDLVARTTVRAR